MSQDSEDDGLSSHLSRFVIWRDALTVRTRTRVYKMSVRCEHIGFVAIAAVDAFHWHSYLFAVSIWLLLTGVIIEIFGGVE